MTDLFNNIMSDLEATENVNSGSKQTSDAHAFSKPDGRNSDASSSKEKTGSNDSSKSNKDVSKAKKDSAKSKSDSVDKNFAELAEIMATGFRDLKDLLSGNDLEFSQGGGDDCVSEMGELQKSQDLFDEMKEDIIASDTSGLDVTPSLAALCDQLMVLKVSDSIVKKKQAAHLRPKNVDNLKVSVVNKPVWDSLEQLTRIKDSKLQNVQNDLLASAVPIIQVMETLADAKEYLSSLDAKSVIDTLKDSLIFIG